MAQSRVLMAAPRTPSLWSCAMALRPAFTRQFASVVTPTSTSDSLASAPPASVVSGNTDIMRTYKPRTPGVRHLKRPINDHLWKGRPWMPLTIPKKGHGKGGRNCTGKVTVRHHGGGHKTRIRTVDFHRFTAGPQLVERIEYDPGRSAHIALLTHQGNGSKSYIVASEGMRAGDIVQSYRAGIPKDLMDLMGGVIDPGILAAKTVWRGNCLPMHMIPIGTTVFNLGSMARGGAVFCRSAGTHAIVLSKDEVTEDDGTKVLGKYITVKLQSGETRKVSKDACATIGVASNPHHQFRQLGKAGRSRWLNIRPTVRGLAMNSVDHPHGGGRGKSKGNRHPTSPWGTPSKGGYKTRIKSNFNKWVVEQRPRNHGQRREKGGSSA
ncbi:50S ribosomal protein L2 [Plectosphaerella plurivora]|uniref:Large ribosomal subunit protein uL2m n=1 Tax=Plectosphaerella plurivora TaxID=936078 RepID=A0A9P8V994_9PEZI|nr:50S ribosomal protein L2 [Plectosphaerella plurivora]